MHAGRHRAHHNPSAAHPRVPVLAGGMVARCTTTGVRCARGGSAREEGNLESKAQSTPFMGRTWCVLAARGLVLLALIFGMHTMQHLSVIRFMPTFLHERFHLPATRIGVLVAIAMASNIVGNLGAGVLLQLGFSRARIIVWISITMAFMTVGVFLLPLPLPTFYLCVLLFSSVGGLVPSAVMGTAPFHTPSLLGATNGLLVQGSKVGIVVGPPLRGLIAT
jgi:DHA1 family inner membrane transport protein